MDEFSLIQRYFNCPPSNQDDAAVLLGIGDDAAVLKVPENQLLVQTIDTLVAGRHFPDSTSARDIALKSLAVNVSDLVAMAATPAYFVLSLTLPEVDEQFLAEFSAGLFEASERFAIKLVGGDTCKGPLSVTIQATGFVENGGYVARSGAQIGDGIYVSGKLGMASMGLASMCGQIELDAKAVEECALALNQPQPRMDLIPLLREYASAAIDVSDGLVGDLRHILVRSQVGANIEKARLPVHPWIQQHDGYHHALIGGDDYQIAFTVPEAQETEMQTQAITLGLNITRIGEIVDTGFTLVSQQKGESQELDLHTLQGFNHFAS